MVCHTKSCTLSVIFNIFLVFILTWMVLVQQNTQLHSQLTQCATQTSLSSQPNVTLFIINPEWITRTHAKAHPLTAVIIKKEAPAALSAVALALGKKQGFCTLKEGAAYV